MVAELPWTVPAEPLWTPGARQGHWFGAGRINAATSCLGDHAGRPADHPALIWEGEPGDTRTLTYGELADEVTVLARGLRSLGVRPTDRVALHLGLLPETVVAMLACAYVGAVYSVIPTPLPIEALAARDVVEHTIVVRRTGIDVDWFEGDRWYHEVVGRTRRGQRATRRPRARPATGNESTWTTAGAADGPADLPADHPLLVMALAHRRGRPLTVQHSAAAILTSALGMHRYGLVDGPVTWCAGDISWLGTQAHGIYGPLLAGDTAIIYEGTVDVPTWARAWEILGRHGVTTLLTTPSVLRMMRHWSNNLPRPADSGQLRRVVVFGEPVDPEIREWAARGLVGDGIPVADAWGQAELGGIVVIDDPTRPDELPRAGEQVVGLGGEPVEVGQPGELVLTRPWPGRLVSAAGPAEALDADHWARLPGVYTTGDLATWAGVSTLEYLGRTDEVCSVSGQLISLGEVREVLADHPFVGAVDVFERRDQLGAHALAAAVVLTAEADGLSLDAVARELRLSVREMLGGLARPRLIVVVDRFGDELRGDERRRALAAIPVTDLTPARVSWSQVLAAAEYLGST